MVELGSKSPFGQSFNNSVFILPAIVVVLIVAIYHVIEIKDYNCLFRRWKCFTESTSVSRSML
uniref:Uncharacterized protein n=1 Tax=Angiostrongylus cantonensis TaxID=6313 RepID=A0A0K0DA28_ANGCA